MTCIKSIEKRKVRNSLQVKKNNKSSRSILNVFRSNKNIYAQIIDLSGNVLTSASSNDKDLKANLDKKSGIEIAKIVGELVGKRAVEKGIKEVVFNKGPYLYIGRVKSLAEGARESGLSF